MSGAASVSHKRVESIDRVTSAGQGDEFRVMSKHWIEAINQLWDYYIDYGESADTFTIHCDAILGEALESRLRKGEDNSYTFYADERVLILIPKEQPPKPLTARALLESGLVGLWQDRTDITDSVEFARQLRRRAQDRSRS